MLTAEHRKKLLDAIEDDSLVIVYAGEAAHTNEDEYYHPFEVNSQFFWLTGLERHGMILMMTKSEGVTSEMMFIEEFDPTIARWTGKMPTVDEVKEATGIDTVMFLTDFEGMVERAMNYSLIDNVYFDMYRCGINDLPDVNFVKANEFVAKYPALVLKDLHKVICPLRRVKDADEVEDIKKAIGITKRGLERVMKNLEPGMIEYQVQAEFEYSCRREGNRKYAFPTIAGSGINGCNMHYDANDAMLPDNGLILLDLGAKYNNYCSDITRTYPVSGKYTDRQKQYYELVLKANKAVAETAKPGMTLRELNELTKKILGEGLVEMGKIESVDEVGKYYMHGVSHSIGIDAHDINFGKAVLEPGWVISDEPGLYIDEEEIGIRIEDDLLITEDGCEVLSKDVIKEIDEIEAFMKERKGL